MTTATINYGSAAAVTATLASLASSSTLLAGRTSDAVDNATSTKAVDYAVRALITTGTSPTGNTTIELWCAASVDQTNYAGGNGGSDANKTHTQETKECMQLLSAIRVNSTSNVGYEIDIPSLAGALGGAIPPKFSFFVVHNTGVNLNSTAGNHEIKVVPIKYDSA